MASTDPDEQRDEQDWSAADVPPGLYVTDDEADAVAELVVPGRPDDPQAA